MATPKQKVGEVTVPPVADFEKLFTFPTGDIAVYVTYEGIPITGKVCSQALALASPVFAKFVYPPWLPPPAVIRASVVPSIIEVGLKAKETNPSAKLSVDGNDVTDAQECAKKELDLKEKGGEEQRNADRKNTEKKKIVEGEIARQTAEKAMATELHFMDDDGDALLMHLQIAHLKFKTIPTTLPFKEMLQVAILCDMYNCNDLVQPWILGWLSNEGFESRKHGQEGWIFIAWVFGREKVFENLAKRLVMEVGWDNTIDKELCIKLPKLIPEGLVGMSKAFPQEHHFYLLCLTLVTQTLVSMAKTRLETIAKHLKLYNEFAVKYTSQTCRHKNESCTVSLYGSVVLPLIQLGVWPPKDRTAQACTYSINAFSSPVLKQKIHTPAERSPNHYQCSLFGVEIRNAVAHIINEIPSPLLEPHRRHFQQKQ